MHKVSKYIIIAVSALAASIIFLSVMPQILTILLLSIFSIVFIDRSVSDIEMRARIKALFFITFFLQLAISLTLYDQTVHTKYYGFSYKGDDYVYGDFGAIVGDLWRQGIFPKLDSLRYYNLIGNYVVVQNYQLYNAFIFFLFGWCAPQILLSVNCFLHAFIIVPVYFICKDLRIKSSVIFFTFLLFLFWPSTFFWSLFNFKEPMLLFGLFAAFAVLIKIRERPSFKRFVALLFFLSIIYCLKEYMIFVIAIAIIYLFISWKWEHKNIMLLFFLLFLIAVNLFTKPAYLSLFFNVDEFFGTASGIRYTNRFSETSYFTNLSADTPFKALIYFPFGLGSMMFLPFLLKPFNLFQVCANIESIMWWCLIPLFINGIWIAVREEFKKTFPIITTLLFWMIILAFTQSNMGTLIKQKAFIYYGGFIFICLAVDRISLSLHRQGPGR